MMKTTIILLLLACALLSSCSYNYTYPSKKITVRKTDGSEKEYGLLSVRGDSAIVVIDWAESHVTPLPYSHSLVLRKDSISNILRLAHGGGDNANIGMLAGALLGGIIASQFTKPVTNDFLDFSRVQNFFTVLGGICGGCIIGNLIGDLIPHYKDAAFNKNVSPYSKDEVSNKNDSPLNHGWDTEFLRSISLYPNIEPEQMQYIK